MKIVKSLDTHVVLDSTHFGIFRGIADSADSHFLGYLSQNAFPTQMNVSRWCNSKNEKRRWVDTIFIQWVYLRVETRLYKRSQIANSSYNLVVKNEYKSDDFLDSEILNFSSPSRRAENSLITHPDFSDSIK